MMLDLDDLMDFAVRTAKAAGRITRSYFGNAAVEMKSDGSEVTIADTSAEAHIRDAITTRFPDHGIFGEEGARVEGSAGHRWIIDPIDGTRSFATGVPLYGVLLALEVEGRPLLGCCHLPQMDETVVAAVGAGCWWNGARSSVSSCDRLEDARVVTSGLEYWRDWATPAGRDGFDRLVKHCRFARTWGDSFGYLLIATGRAEILADPACGALWDLAPMIPIVTEAGGRFTTLSDGEIGAWTSSLATNARLHPAALECWNGLPDSVLQTDIVRQKALADALPPTVE